MKTIAIVHFNTPELTEACILSIRKVGINWPVYIFENSDERPLKKRLKNTKLLNNRNGQLVDFDAELQKYPDKCWEMAKRSNWGSVKHMMSVQKLWDLLPDGFILVESDVLIRKNFEFLWDETFAATGKAQWFKGRRQEKDRLLPWLCYMNVPLLTANGAKYYDPERSWGLQPGGMKNPNNWYDTGAPMLEDIIKTKPQLTARLYPNLDEAYLHYNGGSWRQYDVEEQKAWVQRYAELWQQ